MDIKGSTLIEIIWNDSNSIPDWVNIFTAEMVDVLKKNKVDNLTKNVRVVLEYNSNHLTQQAVIKLPGSKKYFKHTLLSGDKITSWEKTVSPQKLEEIKQYIPSTDMPLYIVIEYNVDGKPKGNSIQITKYF